MTQNTQRLIFIEPELRRKKINHYGSSEDLKTDVKVE